MSKDIWHTADLKPKSLKTFVYKTDKGHIGTSMLTIDSGWNPVLLPEFYSMDDFDKAERITVWAYLDDLLHENTQLTHEVDIAMDGLKRIEKLTEPSYKNRNLEALVLAVNTFSGEIIEQINQRNNNE